MRIKGIFLLGLLLFSSAQAYAGDALLTWTAPTTNADGTPLTDLAGYKVYRGNVSGQYADTIDVGMISGAEATFTYTDLPEGEHFFSVTAYDTENNESDYSNEVKKRVVIPPARIMDLH